MEKFPVIDFSLFETNAEAVATQVIDACTKWGFMILTNYGILSEDVQAMIDVHKDFCAQPIEVKSERTINEHQIGYDLKRSRIGFSEGMVFGGVRGDIVTGRNTGRWWSQDKLNRVEAFKESCQELNIKLLQIFASHFHLPKDYFSSAHDLTRGPGSVLRMLHYPKLDEAPPAGLPRLYEHTDWGSLTFVWPQSGGLEVETPSKKWMEVPLVDGGVVVNIGDALSLWSGRKLKSTLHKINFDKLPIDEERWSMAYFVNANKDAKLEMLDGCEERAKNQEPSITMGDYHAARLIMSQREDVQNNWLANAQISDAVRRATKLVEELGIANGSGKIELAPIAPAATPAPFVAVA